MNCIDLRREALAQPLRLGEQARDHMETCPACRAFVERQRELDARLFDALQVPAPDGLADRILVAHGIRRRRAPWIWGIAASIVVAAGIASVAPAAFSGRALAGEAIAHVHEEPQALRLLSAHSPAMLPTELATQGMRLTRALGEVTYATLCPMASGKAMHIVVATPNGPVTLLLLPSDTTRRRRTLVESDGMTAIAIPAARGSIAIVAKSREQALAIENALILS
jgi:predicted anti-sigma-YlaC factor YlaD